METKGLESEFCAAYLLADGDLEAELLLIFIALRGDWTRIISESLGLFTGYFSAACASTPANSSGSKGSPEVFY